MIIINLDPEKDRENARKFLERNPDISEYFGKQILDLMRDGLAREFKREWQAIKARGSLARRRKLKKRNICKRQKPRH